MAAAVFDVNKDGKLDIVCGGYWYEAPTWKKHFLRNVETINGRPDGYAHQVLDVNGDGFPDIITINWRSRSVRWIENPGPDLGKEQEWKSHVIATPGNMETGRIVDILGDGTPCILPSTVPYWWEFVRKPGTPAGRQLWLGVNAILPASTSSLSFFMIYFTQGFRFGLLRSAIR